MTAPIPERTPEQDRSTQRKLEEGAARAAQIREAKAARGGPATPLAGLVERVAAHVATIPPARGLRLEVPDDVDTPRETVLGDVLRRAMVTPRFQRATIAEFEPSTPSQHAARAAVQIWLERALAGQGGMLALIAPTGRGKSHLLYAAANALADQGRRFYARPWYRLADELRYGGTHPITNRQIEAAEVRATLLSYPIVLLDEVRPTASTAFDDTELAKLACHAYDANLSVIITTNVSPLSDVMGPAAASRFTQLVLDGPDRRQK